MPGELFRQEIHSTTVNCLAENEIGAILSRDIQIMAGNVAVQIERILIKFQFCFTHFVDAISETLEFASEDAFYC